MTVRRLSNWLESYVEYASITEAPKKFHFWAGVSALAGALRRRVWIDQVHFRWYANFYIILVAPPGVVSKTTTADMAMNLLKKVPGIKFGPDVVTWPALVTAFAASCESFQCGEEWLPMSPLTLVASEMGSLIDLQDKAMVNMYIALWDGKDAFEKVTKTNGKDTIEGTWINMIACTTPQWLAETMPSVAVGGGFTSRCVFLYADKKDKYIPFVDEVVAVNNAQLREDLIHDLEHISTTLVGPIKISEEARAWYRPVYHEFWRTAKERMDTKTLEGYAARKQTLLFKTAIILCVARGDDQTIKLEDVQLASLYLDAIEEDMNMVFATVGRSDIALQATRFIEYVKRKGTISYEEAYRQVHIHFPDMRDFEGILSGAVRSGQIKLVNGTTGFVLQYCGGDRN